RAERRTMKYQKYITVMQMALGVTASNKEHCLPPKRRMWVTPSSDTSTTGASSVSASQGKPSLRRIKGRIHRSKSLDSMDLLDCNFPKEEESESAAAHLFRMKSRPGTEWGVWPEARPPLASSTASAALLLRAGATQGEGALPSAATEKYTAPAQHCAPQTLLPH
ncbi:hypothetical protein Z043_102355, partial [Scleropages formosus]